MFDDCPFTNPTHEDLTLPDSALVKLLKSNLAFVISPKFLFVLVQALLSSSSHKVTLSAQDLDSLRPRILSIIIKTLRFWRVLTDVERLSLETLHILAVRLNTLTSHEILNAYNHVSAARTKPRSLLIAVAPPSKLPIALRIPPVSRIRSSTPWHECAGFRNGCGACRQVREPSLRNDASPKLYTLPAPPTRISALSSSSTAQKRKAPMEVSENSAPKRSRVAAPAFVTRPQTRSTRTALQKTARDNQNVPPVRRSTRIAAARDSAGTSKNALSKSSRSGIVSKDTKLSLRSTRVLQTRNRAT